MTRAWYNDTDLYAAQWLRNLIQRKLIPDGDVDTRSIADVRPADLRGYTQCHFFAGLGGWPAALRRSRVWPDHRPVWTGSCPCQPFSVAGKQGGFADERHLWPQWRYLIAQCRPATVLGEQVASASQWLGLVRGDLEALDYAVGAMPVEAASAGAFHLRDRYWFVAHAALPEGARQRPHGGEVLRDEAAERYYGPSDMEHPSSTRLAVGPLAEDQRGDVRFEGAPAGEAGDRGHDAGIEWVLGADGKARPVEPGIRLLAHGVQQRVAKLRALGNAIDLRPATAWVQAVHESLTQ